MFCISGNAMLPTLRKLRINYLTHHPTGTFQCQISTFHHVWSWQEVYWRKCMDLSKCNRAELRILYGQGNKKIIEASAFLSKYAIARRESIQFQCFSKKSLIIDWRYWYSVRKLSEPFEDALKTNSQNCNILCQK